MTQLKAYVQIDDLSDAEIPSFQAITTMFFVEYSLVNIRAGKRLYIGLIKDSESIPDFLESIKTKNPEVLGVFDIDGIQWGKSVKITPATYEGDEILTEEEKIITGEAIYPFQQQMFLDMMPDEHTYDEEGKMLTTTRPVEVNDLKNFGGWADCIF